MSSTRNSQNLLTNVFRPAYTYDGSSFQVALVASNMTAVSATKLRSGILEIGDGGSNVFLGCNAGVTYSAALSNFNNVGLGVSAGAGISNVSNSVFIGRNAGAFLTNAEDTAVIGTNDTVVGTRNTVIGNRNFVYGDNNLVIGTDISLNQSNQINIANLITGGNGVGSNLSFNANVVIQGTLTCVAFDASGLATTNLTVPGYIRNAAGLTPFSMDLSDGNFNFSGTGSSRVSDVSFYRGRINASAGIVGTGFDLSSGLTITGNISNSGSTTSSNFIGTYASSNQLGGITLSNAIVQDNGIPDTFMVAGGATTNTIANSEDGINWTGLGNSIFSSSMRGVAWNGNLWVGVGQGTANTIATSVDGSSWVGRGTSIFTSMGWGAAWNGSLWVAVGQGTNTIATSVDGSSWVGLGTSIFTTSGRGIAWNGNRWVAVGQGLNTLATSVNGSNWTGLATNMFDIYGGGIAWNGKLWVAVGAGSLNTIATSTDGSNWTGLGKTIFSSYGNAIAWNGSLWVAVGGGTNSIATSPDGINWTGQGLSIFSNGANTVAWNGSVWVAGGSPTTTSNTLATSPDGSNWTGRGTSTFSVSGASLASRRYVLPLINSSKTILSNGNASFIGSIITSNSTSSNSIGGVTLSNSDISYGGFIRGSKDATSNRIGGVDLSGGNISNSGTTRSSNFFGTSTASNNIGGVTLSNTNITYAGTITGSTANTNNVIGGITLSNSNAIVGGFLRNALTPTTLDISSGNISNSATTRSSNFIGTSDSASNRIGGVTNSNGTIRSEIVDGFTLAVQSGSFIQSSDTGTSWSSVTFPMTDPYQVAWNGSYWIGVGWNSGGPYIARSTDGTSWTNVTQSVFTGGNYPSVIAWSGTYWLAMCGNSSGTAVAGTSTDGTNWTSATAINESFITSLTWGNGTWLATFSDPFGSLTSAVYTSTDNAVSWSPRTSGMSSVYCSAYNGTVWMIGGVSIAGSDILKTSTDAVGWAPQSVYNSDVYAIAWNGSRWLAVGTGLIDQISISDVADGSSWTGGGLPFGQYTSGANIKSVTWNGNQWIIGSSTGQGIATSPTGNSSTWTPRTTTLTNVTQLASRAYTLPLTSSVPRYFDVSLGNISNSGVTLSRKIGIGTTAPSYSLDVSSATGTAAISMNTWPRASVSNVCIIRGVAGYIGNTVNFSNGGVQNTVDTNLMTVVQSNGTDGASFKFLKSGIWSISFYYSNSNGNSYTWIDVSTNNNSNVGLETAGNPVLTHMHSADTYNPRMLSFIGYLPGSTANFYKVRQSLASGLKTGNNYYFQAVLLYETPTSAGSFPY